MLATGFVWKIDSYSGSKLVAVLFSRAQSRIFASASITASTMLTPEFRLEQSDGFVVVHIKAPYVKVGWMAVCVMMAAN